MICALKYYKTECFNDSCFYKYSIFIAGNLVKLLKIFLANNNTSSQEVC